MKIRKLPSAIFETKILNLNLKLSKNPKSVRTKNVRYSWFD